MLTAVYSVQQRCTITRLTPKSETRENDIPSPGSQICRCYCTSFTSPVLVFSLQRESSDRWKPPIQTMPYQYKFAQCCKNEPLLERTGIWCTSATRFLHGVFSRQLDPIVTPPVVQFGTVYRSLLAWLQHPIVVLVLSACLWLWTWLGLVSVSVLYVVSATIHYNYIDGEDERIQCTTGSMAEGGLQCK